MAGKKVWVTWMPAEAGAPGPDAALGALAKAGLQVSGAKWVDELEKVAWVDLAVQLLDPKAADLWVIAGRRADLAAPRNRYALSLAVAMLRAQREGPLPGFVVGLDFAPAPADLPPLLTGFRCVSGTDAGWPAKVVAGAYAKGAAAAEEWRLNVIGHALIGQWFEVGPASGEWEGAIFGISGGVSGGAGGEAKIVQHAVGPKGELPERTVVEYPARGIKAVLGDVGFVAWAVQNRIGSDQSYFVKVEGHPEQIVFGPAPKEDAPEVVVLRLA
jgi:hypothetical protein